jgi:hypothetical protein
VKPTSWGAAGLAVPTSCQRNDGPTVAVTFNVVATTVLGGMCFATSGIFLFKTLAYCREHLHHWLCRRAEELVARQRADFVTGELPDLEQCVLAWSI